MTAQDEQRSGDRFAFGENWRRFLAVLDEDRIRQAEKALGEMLGETSLAGRSFLDIGSGSGLSSLAARRLGARVTSFDYDPQSVACTDELRRRYFPGDADWSVRQGSVLDLAFMGAFADFDIVYAWGVLHHTGDMWRALDHAGRAVAPGGRLFVAIYNDQGGWSRVWTAIKRLYNKLPRALRAPYVAAVSLPREAYFLALSLLAGRLSAYVRSWTEYRSMRGMSRWHDLVDWVGGYPFEVASPEAIFDFYRDRGFRLLHLKTCGGGLGCNEFVFSKD